MLEIFITIILSAITAEFFGYVTHIVIHSNKIHYLSRSHMIHHMILYGPKTRMRSEKYLTSIINRRGIFGLGFEWLIPIALIFMLYVILLSLIKPALHLSIIFILFNLLWVHVFYNYMHDAMHISGFWMLNNKLFDKWFRGVRSLHDIHHIEVSDEGLMNKNYGICFFRFDKIFGSFSPLPKPFNEKGYQKAVKLYDFVHDDFRK